jgi:hypothetical protein
MRTITLGLAAALLLGAQSGAGRAAEPVLKAFEAVDADGNGVVDIDEYTSHVVRLFNDLDTDDSQTLSPDELPNVDPARFAGADRDGDGMVSIPEAISERVYVFYTTDTVPDGVLSLEEVLAAERN